jgi:hypothetical protein
MTQGTITTAVPVRAPVIRLASFDDYHQIAAVERANGLEPKPQDEWLHLWRNNPAYQSRPDWPIGWVLEKNGKIVGSIGNLPFTYHFGGRTYAGATARGWAVDPDHRKHAFQLLMQSLRQPGIDLFLSTTLSTKAAAIYTSVGFTGIPVGDWTRAAMWITSYTGFARSITAANTGRLSKVAAGILYPAVAIENAVRALRSQKKDRRFQLQWCSGFDDRFDRFWEALIAESPRVLRCERTREALSWHFKYALEQNRLWIVRATEGARVIGYAIVEKRESRYAGLKRLQLVDMAALQGRRHLTSAMMQALLDRCRRERVHVLESAGCWVETAKVLNVKAPFHRSFESSSYLYNARNQELGEALQDARSWYPTSYDGDASL